MERINFDSHAVIEIPFTVGEQNYVLKEATAEVAINYRNAIINCTKLGPDGKPCSVKGLASTQLTLVAGCVFTEEGNKPVHGNTIKGWHPRVLNRLFDEAKRISEIDEEDDKESLVKQRKEIDRKLVNLENPTANEEQTDMMGGSD